MTGSIQISPQKYLDFVATVMAGNCPKISFLACNSTTTAAGREHLSSRVLTCKETSGAFQNIATDIHDWQSY